MDTKRTRLWTRTVVTVGLLALAARSGVGKAELVAGWTFDEGSGAVARDGTGNGHDGAVEGAKWVTGKFGGALEFNGDGDHVFVPHADALNLEAVSVVAWVVPTEWNPDLNAIAQKWEDGTNRRQYQLTVYQEKNWWYVSDAGDNWPRTDATTTIIPLDEWTHLVGTYDGSMMRAYVNGVLDEEKPQEAGLFTSDVDVQIGGYGPTTPVVYGENRHFKGVIDEVYFYDGALTEAEIRALMDAPALAVSARGRAPVVWGAIKAAL
jgi:hypothetical protein